MMATLKLQKLPKPEFKRRKKGWRFSDVFKNIFSYLKRISEISSFHSDSTLGTLLSFFFSLSSSKCRMEKKSQVFFPIKIKYDNNNRNMMVIVISDIYVACSMDQTQF